MESILCYSTIGFLGIALVAYWSFAGKKREQEEAAREREEAARALKAGIREIDVMTGIEFEKYLAVVFQQMGYVVTRTPGSNDFGIDLLLTGAGKRIAVQAKRHSNKVGSGAVQKSVGGKQFYNADECWVVTNSHFTPAAHEFARETGVSLLDREWIIKVANAFNVSGKDFVRD